MEKQKLHLIYKNKVVKKSFNKKQQKIYFPKQKGLLEQQQLTKSNEGITMTNNTYSPGRK